MMYQTVIWLFTSSLSTSLRGVIKMDKIKVNGRCEDFLQKFFMDNYGTCEYDEITLKCVNYGMRTFELKFTQKERALIFFNPDSISVRFESAPYVDYTKTYPLTAKNIKNACNLIDRKRVELIEFYTDRLMNGECKS